MKLWQLVVAAAVACQVAGAAEEGLLAAVDEADRAHQFLGLDLAGPTKDERIEYHQLLEQVRQAQLSSLTKQIAAQQQVIVGYQQVGQGLQALREAFEKEGAAVADKSKALQQWRAQTPGRATCVVGRDGRLQCPAEMESGTTPPATSPPAALREAPER